MSYEWLDRHTVVTPNYTLVTNVDDYREICAFLKDDWPAPWITKDFSGTTHIYTNAEKITCIVCLDSAAFDRTDQIEVIGLIVHEAIHIAQELFKSINEHSPSTEFQAYTIQNISQCLLWEYQRQRNEWLAQKK